MSHLNTSPLHSSLEVSTLPFLQAVHQNCTCAICLGVFLNPHLLPCSHVFCFDCITRTLETNRTQCPLCNRTIKSVRQLTPLPQLHLVTQLARQYIRLEELSLRDEGASSPAPQGAPEQFLSEPPAVEDAAKTIAKESKKESTPTPVQRHLGLTDETQPILLTGNSWISRGRKRQRSPSTTEPCDYLPTGFSVNSVSTVAVPSHMECSTPTKGRPVVGDRFSSVEVVAERVKELIREPTPEIVAAPLNKWKGEEANKESFWNLYCDGFEAFHSSAAHFRVLFIPSIEMFSDKSNILEDKDEDSHCLQWDGCCVLCGLSLYSRDGIRCYLQRLLVRSKITGCDSEMLQTLHVQTLGHLLGPLWGIRISVLLKERISERETALPHVTIPAHQNCLVWAGWLHFSFYVSDAKSLVDVLQRQKQMLSQRSRYPVFSQPIQISLDLPNSAVSSPCCGASALSTQLCSQDSSAPHSSPSSRTTTVTLPRSGSIRTSRLPTARLRRLCEQVWQHLHPTSSPLSCHTAERAREEVCFLCGQGSCTDSSHGTTASQHIFFVDAGLRPCSCANQRESRHRAGRHAGCGRWCHYPCALLAGSTACVVYGLEEAETLLEPTSQENGESQSVSALSNDILQTDPTEVWCCGSR